MTPKPTKADMEAAQAIYDLAYIAQADIDGVQKLITLHMAPERELLIEVASGVGDGCPTCDPQHVTSGELCLPCRARKLINDNQPQENP